MRMASRMGSSGRRLGRKDGKLSFESEVLVRHVRLEEMSRWHQVAGLKLTGPEAGAQPWIRVSETGVHLVSSTLALASLSELVEDPQVEGSAERGRGFHCSTASNSNRSTPACSPILRKRSRSPPAQSPDGDTMVEKGSDHSSDKSPSTPEQGVQRSCSSQSGRSAGKNSKKSQSWYNSRGHRVSDFSREEQLAGVSAACPVVLRPPRLRSGRTGSRGPVSGHCLSSLSLLFRVLDPDGHVDAPSPLP
ncbi:hypothetical protein J1605_015727 [Eschrichtius robustus]|uniref:Uncharacterized protein n=1 Tax=Eschrichtius robustus TaxID=9764 RepID=A0AB34GAY7_ESCRO|nr:hypothetical protein J1605_015727 [Eschrichtius robustus]